MRMLSSRRTQGPQKPPGAEEGRPVGSSFFFPLEPRLLLFLLLQTGFLFPMPMTDSSCHPHSSAHICSLPESSRWNGNLLAPSPSARLLPPIRYCNCLWPPIQVLTRADLASLPKSDEIGRVQSGELSGGPLCKVNDCLTAVLIQNDVDGRL